MQDCVSRTPEGKAFCDPPTRKEYMEIASPILIIFPAIFWGGFILDFTLSILRFKYPHLQVIRNGIRNGVALAVGCCICILVGDHVFNDDILFYQVEELVACSPANKFMPW